MRRVLVLLAMMSALPFAASSQTAPAARRPATPAAAPLFAPRAAVLSDQPSYEVVPRSDAGAPVRPGWGLFAVLHGRSTDLSSWNGWTVDPDARAHEMEAGYGWRRSNLSAIVGYVQPDFSPANGSSLRGGPGGLVGLNVTLHSR